MANGFRFEASFGGVRIDVTSTSSTHPWRLFPHEFPKKSGAETEDQGRAPQVVSLQFIFINLTEDDIAQDDFQTRFDQFRDLILVNPVRTLVHPYLGQIRCRIGDFSTSGDGEGQPVIRCSATFTEENSETPVLDIDDGAIQTTAGSQAVSQAAVAANNALADNGLESTLPDESVDLAESWGLAFDLSTREVQTQMAEFNSRLNTELASFSAEDDILMVPVIQAYTLLQHRMRKTAESFSTTTPRVIEISTEEVIPLRIIAAEFYGADEADRRFLEMLELNPSLRTPACVPPNVTIKAYSRNVKPLEFRQQ